MQQAVRFALFHVLQAGARAENRAIPAKGLTGPGYDGHAFWDTETFVLPVLTLTAPDAAASALRWRHSTLPRPSSGPPSSGFKGAAFPWRTITGAGVLGLLAGRHRRLPRQRRHRRRGGPLRRRHRRRGVQRRARGWSCSTQTARLWRSLGHHDAQGRFHIDGVTGPDEYSAIADDNVYTNLMAAAEPARGGRRGQALPGPGPRARRRRGGIRELAGRRRGDVHPLRRGARRAPAGRGVHPAPGLGLRPHRARPVPAAAALPLLRPVPQAGRQAGRPGAGHAPARRGVHRRAEG